MSELLDHVDQSIRARRLLLPRQRVLVAVSGGVDSMVLLHLLHALAPARGWRLTAAHLNHQLRGRSSDADERLVRRVAERLNVPLVVERAAVREFACERKVSVEMAARELRHAFLARTARRRRIPVVALAHHADDQVELFFLRLLRGSGGEGLAGMKWRTPSASDKAIELVRPLLDQTKSALVDYAAENRVRYREDASNAALDFQRNRIRHELLPLLRRKYQPALDRTVLRVMEIVGSEAELAGAVAREWLNRARNPKAEIRRPKEGRRPKSEGGGADSDVSGAICRAGGVVGQPPCFDQLPVAVQRRCLQVQLLEQGLTPEYELVERLRMEAGRAVAVGVQGAKSVGKGERGAGETPALRYLLRDREGLVYMQQPVDDGFSAKSIDVALSERDGRVEFDGARVAWRIGRGTAHIRARLGAQVEFFDAEKVGSPIRLRHWQPGDRFQPIGMLCPVKLQDLFTNAKVPPAQRRRRIVATCLDGEIFWVEGLRIAERFKLTQQTIRRLQWRWKRL